MSDQLKKITKKGVPKAIEKAKHYRLLNEPWEAESICRDVLAVDASNQDALVTLVLAMTDQFDKSEARPVEEVEASVVELKGAFEAAYYGGIVKERWAKAQWRRGVPVHVVEAGIRDAMTCYEQADKASADDNDDALLRWNTCVRMLEHIARTKPAPLEHAMPLDTGDSPPLV